MHESNPEKVITPSSWEFAGWGAALRIDDLAVTHEKAEPRNVAPAHKLGPWQATAICGNDITSSVLYVAALCVLSAGVYAPIALIMVALVLFLFRRIYGEVGSALPLNGGAYNVLLNTTTKTRASVAACLTLLSYIATAVISANEALHYLHHVVPATPVFAGTLVLLALFALLNIGGITDSANVALVIFMVHLATLACLIVSGGIYLATHDLSVLISNWQARPRTGITRAIFFGFAAATLGISGFESSANFIEEQQRGVFPKTLRNMWLAVSIINPTICVLALCMVPVSEFASHQEALLAELGARSAGGWLATWVSIDAVLVLSGAVLTSYVGVTGLVRRMTLDRCLPQFLLIENSWRRTPHFIILAFFALCSSVLILTEGDVGVLAGVYAISFLGVMLLFALGNRLLALRRGRLPRDEHASWPAVLLAGAAILVALAGNVLRSIEDASVFLSYFVGALTVVGLMLVRLRILWLLFYVGNAVHDWVGRWNAKLSAWTHQRVSIIQGNAAVFFSRGDSVENLRRAVEYVRANEETNNLKVVHVYKSETEIPTELAEQLRVLDQAFPEIRIDFLAVQGVFGPDLIDKLSVRLGVPKNYMFIGCPGTGFPHQLSDLGGVRLIV